jgi:hypothetical protein
VRTVNSTCTDGEQQWQLCVTRRSRDCVSSDFSNEIRNPERVFFLLQQLYIIALLFIGEL